MQAIIQNPHNATNTPTIMPQLISIHEVIKYTGLSRASIYRTVSYTHLTLPTNREV